MCIPREIEYPIRLPFHRSPITAHRLPRQRGRLPVKGKERKGLHMQYSDYLTELRATDPQLASALGSITNLEHVLSWMQASRLSLANIDVLAQDEYSHDLLIPLLDNRWLVFGMS